MILPLGYLDLGDGMRIRFNYIYVVAPSLVCISVCPGRFFADAGLWLSMACILAAFDISPALDENGRKVLPGKEFTTGSSR